MGDSRIGADLVFAKVALIEHWCGVAAPNEVAIKMVKELETTIKAFEKLRGDSRITDEPASFDAALIEAAHIVVED